jgi:hypothetical protein
MEARAPARVEATLKYHPGLLACLTAAREPGSGTLHGGQFDWGGRLPKSNGGARWWAQAGRKPAVACKRTSPPDCKADGPRRDESRR